MERATRDFFELGVCSENQNGNFSLLESILCGISQNFAGLEVELMSESSLIEQSKVCTQLSDSGFLSSEIQF